MVEPGKISADWVRSQKFQNKVVAVTAYDYTLAKLLDPLVDIILVGDSLGMVIHGQKNTLSVTTDHVIYHSAAVARAVSHALLVADMPFMSFQTSDSDTIRNAGRLLAEGGAEAVKIEGGREVLTSVEKLVSYGIPVMGHVGLTPQKVHAFGGFRVQGRTETARNTIVEDALALEAAGVFSIVLEGIPGDLAQQITERLKVPTIGIGAGVFCDGQVMVSVDLLGLNPEFKPRFVKPYAALGDTIRKAVQEYAGEVRSGKFPDPEHSF